MAWRGYRSDDDAEEADDLPGLSEREIPMQAQVPSAVLIGLMSVAWVISAFRGGMSGWGISGAALAHGRFQTIFLHMFAHGGLWHIMMNVSALSAIGPAVTARLGSPPGSWFRFLLIFVLGGWSGTALYLAIHPFGTVPMLGASGAIYALLGLLLRLPREGEELEPVGSPRTRRVLMGLFKENLWLVLLLTVPALLLGKGGGIAWEAHLGALLFGLFAGPLFLPKPASTPHIEVSPGSVEPV